jgi:hypothetical protein
MVAFAEVERFLADIQVAWRRVQEDPASFGEELREFFDDIYVSGADNPDLVDLLDDLRWILARRDRTADERFDAMIRRFDQWRDGLPH